MKLKFTLLFCCFLSLMQFASAQKIYFTDTTNVWHLHSNDPFMPPGKTAVVKYTGTSIKNDKLYFHHRTGLIREDSAARIVYCIDRTSPADSEYVLYNFNLQVGDTFLSHRAPDGYNKFVLKKLDSVQINGYWHRVQTFAPGEGINIVVEGIGRVYDASSEWLMPPHPDGYERITCFANDGNIVTVPKPSGGDYLSPVTCALSVQDTRAANGGLSIVPHPATNTSIMYLPMPVTGRLVITNLVGQAVIAKTLNAQQQLKLDMLTAEGLYLYQVTDTQTGISYSGKLVFHP